MLFTEVKSIILLYFYDYQLIPVVPVWKAPVYNSPKQNWKRGLYAISTGTFIMEPLNHFRSNMHILSQFYENPKTRSEYNIFFKEVFRLPEFWPELAKKVTFGLITGGGDAAVKLAAWQWIYGGTYSPQDFADSNSFKHLTCAIMAFAPTCWTGIPFENARRAYYADKTWPLELRRGYTSPMNALLRIPFEESPLYLFKGGFPIWTSAFVFWTTYTTFYSFIKNKYFFLWTYNDFNYDFIKAGNLGFSFGLASFLAYPFYFTREMVDLWPKERGGHCTWNNSYRQCAKWMIENMDMLYFNFLTGYTRWLRRHGFYLKTIVFYIFGLQYLIALWMADTLGMFSNCNEAWASIEYQSPISSESV